MIDPHANVSRLFVAGDVASVLQEEARDPFIDLPYIEAMTQIVDLYHGEEMEEIEQLLDNQATDEEKRRLLNVLILTGRVMRTQENREAFEDLIAGQFPTNGPAAA